MTKPPAVALYLIRRAIFIPDSIRIIPIFIPEISIVYMLDKNEGNKVCKKLPLFFIFFPKKWQKITHFFRGSLVKSFYSFFTDQVSCGKKRSLNSAATTLACRQTVDKNKIKICHGCICYYCRSGIRAAISDYSRSHFFQN